MPAMRRFRPWRWLIGLSLILVLIAGAGVAGRFWLARQAIDRILAGQGYAADYTIERLGADGARIGHLALPPYGIAGRVDLNWTAASLRRARATDIVIDDLSLSLPATNDDGGAGFDPAALPDPALLARLPFDRLTIHRLTLKAGPGEAIVPRLTLDFTGGTGWALSAPVFGLLLAEPAAAATGRAELAGQGWDWPRGAVLLAASGPAGLTGRGRYEGTAAGPRLAFDAAMGRDLSARLTLRPLAGGFARLDGRLRVALPQATAVVDLDGVVRPQGLAAALGGRIAVESDGVSVTAPVDLTVANGAATLAAGRTAARIDRDGAALDARLDGLRASADPAGRLRLRAGPLAVDGTAAGQALQLAVPDISARVDGAVRRLAARGGGARLETVDVSVSDLALDLRDGPDGRRLSLAAGLSQRAALPWFRPLSLTLSGDGPAGKPLRLSARLADAAGHVSIAGRGSADLEQGRIDGVAALAPMAVAGKGPRVATLSPRLAAMAPGFAGTVGLLARFGWDGESLTTGGEILVKDASLAEGDLVLSGLNAALTARSLLPPILAKGQTIALAGLSGLPLSNGTLRFGYDGRRIAIESAGFDLAGGRVTAGAVALDPARPQGRLVLTAKDLDLSALLSLAQVEGLSGTGRLSGTLPLDIATAKGGKPEVAIRDGTLSAAGGRLAYSPSGSSGLEQGGGAVALDALRNFHYDALTMTINGTLGAEQSFGLDLTGRNPDFYNGYPVHFAISIKGRIDSIVRAGLLAYKLPGDISRDLGDLEARLRNFTGATPP